MNQNLNTYPAGAANESGEKVESHDKTQEETYWAAFYERNDFNDGSTFFDFINGLPQLPETVVDIGCGQGRDSFAFANEGRQVLGLDRSETGIMHANNKAVYNSLESSLSFSTCDVSDYVSLYENLNKAREQANNENVLYYMRFFLHSIPEDAQDTLLQVISSHAQTGDVLTAEFRTDKDENQLKAFGDTHYRRYQNADDFSRKLKDDYGWEDIAFETESRGLSPYGDEDPTLYRVIAVR